MPHLKRQNLSPQYEAVTDVVRLQRNRFYSIGEVADLLRVTDRSVWRWLKSGALHAVTYGKGGPVRIRGEAIFAFLKPYKAKTKPKKVRRKIIRRSHEPGSEPSAQ